MITHCGGCLLDGAGKTTTIEMLTTLLLSTSGSARVAGYDITRQAAEVRRGIGYVPQMLSAGGTLTGYENLLIFAKLYDLPSPGREERVREALAFMGLSPTRRSVALNCPNPAKAS